MQCSGARKILRVEGKYCGGENATGKEKPRVFECGVLMKNVLIYYVIFMNVKC